MQSTAFAFKGLFLSLIYVDNEFEEHIPVPEFMAFQH